MSYRPDEKLVTELWLAYEEAKRTVVDLMEKHRALTAELNDKKWLMNSLFERYQLEKHGTWERSLIAACEEYKQNQMNEMV